MYSNIRSESQYDLMPTKISQLKAKQRIPKILFDMTYILTVYTVITCVHVHIHSTKFLLLLEVVKSNAVQHKILWILYFTHFCSLSSLLILYAFSFLLRRINAWVFYFPFIYQIRHVHIMHICCVQLCHCIYSYKVLVILTSNV